MFGGGQGGGGDSGKGGSGSWNWGGSGQPDGGGSERPILEEFLELIRGIWVLIWNTALFLAFACLLHRWAQQRGCKAGNCHVFS